MIQFKVRSFYDVHDDVFDDCVQTEITTTATQVLPRHVRKIDHDGNYVILKSEQSDMTCDITYPHTHALVNGDILTPDEYDEKISIEDFVISLENATSENELIQLLEAKNKSFLLDAESKCIHVSLYSTPINRKQSKKYIVKKIAEYILDWQKALNEARNPQENITLNAEVRDISERKALNQTTEVKALPATASQQEDKNDCHKFCVGDFFTFLDEYYTVIKRTPCYVFLRDKNYRTIRASLGIYNRDFNDGTIKGDEFITFEVSKHEYKIDAKDKEEKPAELIRQEQKLKPEPIKKRSPEEAQNLPKYVYEITPKGHYVIMDNEVLSKGLPNRREWQIPHLAPFKYGDVIHPENYEISIKISNIALQLENAKDEKTVREILKKYDKSFIRDIACNAYHFAFDEYERHSVFSFKTTKKDLLALLIKAVLKVNEAMRDAQSKSQPAQENKPASQTKKHTRKSKQEIIPFQLGMFYIANIDGRNFNARVTAFIEHFRKFSKADKNGKIKNKIVRTKDVCFDVLYNGEIKHVQAGISIDKDSGCEYITTVIYPPVKMSANNPVEGATPHSASDITTEYNFKLNERYPYTLRDYYGNIKCVSSCDSSVTFEYGAYNSDSYCEQDLLTVPVFVDPETKSQFVHIGSQTCYAHDSNQDNKPQETSKNVQNETHEAKPDAAKYPVVRFRLSDFAMDTNPAKYTKLSLYNLGLKRNIVLEYEKLTKAQMIAAIVEGIQQSEQKQIDDYYRSQSADADKKSDTQQEAKSKNTPKRTRTPRKRVQVTAQDILSCQNENDALSLLMTLKKEDMKNIARDLKISIHSSRRFKINWFMSKEQIARYIAHQLFLRRKIQAKKTSNHDEAPKTNKLENFSYSANKKTGQISFLFE